MRYGEKASSVINNKFPELIVQGLNLQEQQQSPQNKCNPEQIMIQKYGYSSLSQTEKSTKVILDKLKGLDYPQYQANKKKIFQKLQQIKKDVQDNTQEANTSTPFEFLNFTSWHSHRTSFAKLINIIQKYGEKCLPIYDQQNFFAFFNKMLRLYKEKPQINSLLSSVSNYLRTHKHNLQTFRDQLTGFSEEKFDEEIIEHLKGI